MNREKKDLLVLRSIEVVLIIITAICMYKPKTKEPYGFIYLFGLLLAPIAFIYIGYRIKLHKKKYMKSERREKCNGEEK